MRTIVLTGLAGLILTSAAHATLMSREELEKQVLSQDMGPDCGKHIPIEKVGYEVSSKTYQVLDLIPGHETGTSRPAVISNGNFMFVDQFGSVYVYDKNMNLKSANKQILGSTIFKGAYPRIRQTSRADRFEVDVNQLGRAYVGPEGNVRSPIFRETLQLLGNPQRMLLADGKVGMTPDGYRMNIYSGSANDRKVIASLYLEDPADNLFEVAQKNGSTRFLAVNYQDGLLYYPVDLKKDQFDDENNQYHVIHHDQKSGFYSAVQLDGATVVLAGKDGFLYSTDGKNVSRVKNVGESLTIPMVVRDLESGEKQLVAASETGVIHFYRFKKTSGGWDYSGTDGQIQTGIRQSETDRPESTPMIDIGEGVIAIVGDGGDIAFVSSTQGVLGRTKVNFRAAEEFERLLVDENGYQIYRRPGPRSLVKLDDQSLLVSAFTEALSKVEFRKKVLARTLKRHASCR